MASLRLLVAIRSLLVLVVADLEFLLGRIRVLRRRVRGATFGL